MTWPEQVIVLEPEDFVVGPYDCGTRFCLLGWLNHFFSGGDFKAWEVARHKLTDICAQQSLTYLCEWDSDDTPKNRRLAAWMWATLIEDLGYTEDGPTVEMWDDHQSVH